jgi:quercetin dioxygenase-like cupin family protein
MIGASAVVRAKGEGERRWFYGGGVLTMKATSAETGGALLLFEDEMTRGKRTPLHVHANEDETFYVLEGEIRVHVDGVDHAVAAGGLAMIPRGIPHAFLVVSETARVLTLLVPGTAEPFYRAASEPLAAHPGVVDFDRGRAAAEQTGAMRVVGPPPFPDSLR